MLITKNPDTPELLEAYFHFRWLHLREPWNFPPGSEKDEYEQVGEHRVVLNEQGRIVAAGRVHFNIAEEAQIRHIAVHPEYRDKGVGKLILAELEKVAKEMGAIRAITISRETSIEFFAAAGFVMEKQATNELGLLKRHQMVKQLNAPNSPLRHPNWCAELQQTWEETIPISQHMGIRLKRYTGYRLEVLASLNKNVNLHGTMFAGSIFSLATLAGWGLIFLQLKKHQLSGEIVLGDGDIHYHKPVSLKPVAVCDLSSMKDNFDKLKKGKKCPIRLSVKIMDDTTPVAEFSGVFWVLPSPKD